MSKITIAAAGAGQIPGAAGRKALCIFLKTGDAVWGFQDVVTTSGANEGIPLPLQQQLSFTADSPRSFAGPINFASTAGAEILYTERF